MPNVKQPDHSGDLYARLLVTVPENLSPLQREAVEDLRTKLQ